MPKSFADLQKSPRHLTLWQKAQQNFIGGRYERAAESYRFLLRTFPDISGLWFELGLAAARLLDYRLAREALQRTVELSPNDVSMLVLAGQQFHSLRLPDQARSCFERALQAAPESLHARLSLADWYERERRLELAWDCLASGEGIHGDDPQFGCVKALVLHRLKRPAEAESLLRQIIQSGRGDLNVQYSSRQQLAGLLDESGQYAEALRWLRAAKEVLRKTANIPQLELEYDRGVRRRNELLKALKPADLVRWRAESPATSGPPRLAFLGGHPRSGTTLLEQILGAHPALAALDESPAFVEEVANQLAPLTSATAFTLKKLVALTPSQCEWHRNRYWKSLLRSGPRPAGTEVVLDKNPSLTAMLHQWLRLFPALKVIIALRDPRDVLVSTFFVNVRMNPTSANFLSLERTAKHYTDLMDVWLRMRELGGFDWIESRYEALVENAEPESRRVSEFLGLTWHPAQASAQEQARGTFVYAPTYHAVTEPVHRRALGRWRNYAEALAPLQERLAPYCQALGYAN